MQEKKYEIFRAQGTRLQREFCKRTVRLQFNPVAESRGLGQGKVTSGLVPVETMIGLTARNNSA
jgi:hypothetical protein